MRRLPKPMPQIKGRGWLLSFNDLLTVLLAFFILIVALSSFNASKMKIAAASANKVFRQVGTEGAINIKTADALNRIEGLNVRTEKRGVRVSLPDNFLYERGSDALQPAAAGKLHELAGVLKQAGRTIRVEGHTDNVDIRTARFPSNWELSAARAISVVKYLAEKEGVPVDKLSAAGYADSRPVATNKTEIGRASNRRTEIILVMQEEPWRSKK